MEAERDADKGRGKGSPDETLTPAEQQALAELERQERAERLTRIRAEQEAERQRVEQEQARQLAAIRKQLAATTAGDGELRRKRTRIADVLDDYLRAAEERRLKLLEVEHALAALPWEVGAQAQIEVGQAGSTAFARSADAAPDRTPPVPTARPLRSGVDEADAGGDAGGVAATGRVRPRAGATRDRARGAHRTRALAVVTPPASSRSAP